MTKEGSRHRPPDGSWFRQALLAARLKGSLCCVVVAPLKCGVSCPDPDEASQTVQTRRVLGSERETGRLNVLRCALRFASLGRLSVAERAALDENPVARAVKDISSIVQVFLAGRTVQEAVDGHPLSVGVTPRR